MTHDEYKIALFHMLESMNEMGDINLTAARMLIQGFEEHNPSLARKMDTALTHALVLIDELKLAVEG